MSKAKKTIEDIGTAPSGKGRKKEGTDKIPANLRWDVEKGKKLAENLVFLKVGGTPEENEAAKEKRIQAGKEKSKSTGQSNRKLISAQKIWDKPKNSKKVEGPNVVYLDSIPLSWYQATFPDKYKGPKDSVVPVRVTGLYSVLQQFLMYHGLDGSKGNKVGDNTLAKEILDTYAYTKDNVKEPGALQDNFRAEIDVLEERKQKKKEERLEVDQDALIHELRIIANSIRTKNPGLYNENGKRIGFLKTGLARSIKSHLARELKKAFDGENWTIKGGFNISNINPVTGEGSVKALKNKKGVGKDGLPVGNAKLFPVNLTFEYKGVAVPTNFFWTDNTAAIQSAYVELKDTDDVTALPSQPDVNVLIKNVKDAMKRKELKKDTSNIKDKGDLDLEDVPEFGEKKKKVTSVPVPEEEEEEEEGNEEEED